MGKMADWFMDFLYDLAYYALYLLPSSPFQLDSVSSVLEKFQGIMANINYFIPFGDMLLITFGYVAAVLIWYGLRWILRLAQYID